MCRKSVFFSLWGGAHPGALFALLHAVLLPCVILVDLRCILRLACAILANSRCGRILFRPEGQDPCLARCPALRGAMAAHPGRGVARVRCAAPGRRPDAVVAAFAPRPVYACWAERFPRLLESKRRYTPCWLRPNMQECRQSKQRYTPCWLRPNMPECRHWRQGRDGVVLQALHRALVHGASQDAGSTAHESGGSHPIPHRDSRFTVAVHTPLQASATPHENGGSHPTHPESCRHPDIFSS